MDIWQRGTSFTATNGSTSSYGPDRWNIYCGRAGLTISRQTSGLTGFQYSMRVQRDSGNTAVTDVVITQALETVESLKYAGQQVTVSFWAKAGANYSPTGSVLTAQIRTGTGTDQIIWNGYTGTSTIASSNVTLTTSWQRFSVTGSAASTATELTLLFANTPTGTASTNDWYEITGVQLEIGNVATAFSRAGGTIQGELSACQRYLPAIYGGSYAGYAYATNSILYAIPFPVNARVAPTGITVTGTWTGYSLNSGSNFTPTFNLADKSGASIDSSGGRTITAGQGSRLESSGGVILFTGCEL
jgi:hypothetical protein